MAFWGFLKKLGPAPTLVVDVGSHSLKGIAFTLAEGGRVPQVLKKAVSVLPNITDPNHTIRALHEFLSATTKELGRIPKKVVIGLGPGVAECSVRTLHIPLSSPKRTISVAELTTAFQDTLRDNQDPTRFAFAYPLEIFANGYPLRAAVLQERNTSSIQDIDFTTLFARLASEIGNALEETRRMFSGMHIEFIPVVRAYQETLVNTLQFSQAFLIDIGYQHTTLLHIRDRVIAHTTAFSHGTYRFTHAIVKQERETLTEAQESLRHYTQGLLETPQQEAMTRTLAIELENWRGAFLTALESFYPTGPLPEQVLVCGGGATIPGIKTFLAQSDWIKNFSVAEKPTLRLLEGSSVFSGDSAQGFIQGPEEAGLASLINYTLHHESVFSEKTD